MEQTKLELNIEEFQALQDVLICSEVQGDFCSSLLKDMDDSKNERWYK